LTSKPPGFEGARAQAAKDRRRSLGSTVACSWSVNRRPGSILPGSTRRSSSALLREKDHAGKAHALVMG
jgi:hypothetical protein